MKQKRSRRPNQKKGPFPFAEHAGAEGIYQKRDVGDGYLKTDTDDKSCNHKFIGKMIHSENRASHIAHTYGVEKLRDTQGGESVGLGMRENNGHIQYMCKRVKGYRNPKTYKHGGGQKQKGSYAEKPDQDAVKDGDKQTAVSKEGFVFGSGRTFHMPFGIVHVDAECQRRQRVCNQVHPQNVTGL